MLIAHIIIRQKIAIVCALIALDGQEITIVLVFNVSDKIVEDLNGVVLFQQPVFFYKKIK
jgi:hypothetical protein